MVTMSSPALDLFQQFWSWRLRRTPEFATFVGVKDYNSVLESITEQRYQEDYDTCCNFLQNARELLKSTNSPSDKENLEFFVSEVSTFTEGHQHGGFYFPLNYMEGLHVDFVRLAEWATPSTLQDYQDIVTRYLGFSQQAEQVREIMRAGSRKGLTVHSVSVKGVAEECLRQADEPAEQSAFYSPFSSLDCGAEEEIKELQSRALAAIKDSVQVGLRLLGDFLQAEYEALCRPEIAATSLPGGQEFYAACLKFHTTTDLTAQQIHEMGHKEVNRIETEMKDIIKELGHDVSLKQFIEDLRVDKSNFFTSKEELLAAGKEIVFDKIYPRLTKLFTNVPRTKLEVNETPSSEYPAAFYLAGTEDGSRPGKYSLNTFKFSSQPRYEMISLSLHEACPGHHLQGSYLLEKPGVARFRKAMEDRNYFQSPSRFPFYTAYGEGWALYCETLGTELGLYEDPLDRFGHLSEDIFRACRLVVDTGMHALGWSMEQAVDYMLEHSAASRENVEGEVRRYVTWPGQAVGYKVGQIKILQLREMAEKEMGDRFNIKTFHDIVLDCAGPLDILETKIREYMQT